MAISKGELSKALFSRTDRVDVWGYLLGFSVNPPKAFCTQQVQNRLKHTQGVSASNTSAEITSYLDLGMIRVAKYSEIPQNPVLRGVYYVRTDSELWRIAAVAVDVFTDRFSDPNGQTSV